jgi:hypothetical protein
MAVMSRALGQFVHLVADGRIAKFVRSTAKLAGVRLQ